uniref:RRM domain-containing protein n=1 Tax=Tetraselmis sp. GSL018 TaxID=582737 RepID=A0A061S688_9CHLO|eukprot:CAMPEP_0177597700 /NCGR_PEP_ID=MMETSP0419_2-20121207/11868_1 /TAXON_ID=582737 /ORGANISM="Tetraselmis sp., Strain GSL018" /LENGTH=163 /DNA_ID=CAMNT_0019089921 /DNA_START=219 /DNA_END=710 /DNA_ORIENTATION=-
MTGTPGIRIGLGVITSNAGVVGTSNVTSCAHSSAPLSKHQHVKCQQNGGKEANWRLHQSLNPEDCRASRHPKSNRSLTVALSNLPSHVEKDDVHAILAPWSNAVIQLSHISTCEDSGLQTYHAEMQSDSALEAVTELNERIVAGTTVLVEAVRCGLEDSVQRN